MPDLIDFLDSIPAAATADPITSHEAAAEITASGLRAKQMRQVAEAVKDHPGSTSLDLAVLAKLDRHLVARRLPDAEKLGLVKRGSPRVCNASPTQKRAITWWPAN